MASQFAPNSTRLAYAGSGTDNELVINSENPVQIYSMVLTIGSTATLFTLRDSDETVICVLRPAVSRSTEFTSSFLCTNGLTIDVDQVVGGVDITVYHS